MKQEKINYDEIMALSISKDKLEYHLNRSVRAWHTWDKNMPMSVEVICNELANRYGKFLTVKKWLIIPPESGLKECLVAEFDMMVNFLGKEVPLRLHINHLIPIIKHTEGNLDEIKA